jgi:hypothetical protein
MQIQNVTLGEFERRHGVNKGTVSKKARELGYSTTDGLTPEAYERLKLEFKVDEAKTAKTDVVDETPMDAAGALGHYFGGSLGAPGGGGFSLGDMTTRTQTREARRLAVAQGFQEVTFTREDRRSMLIQAAIADADDDSEVYAAVYQSRLSKNLQRHGMAGGMVMGKDIEQTSEDGGGSSTAA